MPASIRSGSGSSNWPSEAVEIVTPFGAMISTGWKYPGNVVRPAGIAGGQSLPVASCPRVESGLVGLELGLSSRQGTPAPQPAPCRQLSPGDESGGGARTIVMDRLSQTFASPGDASPTGGEEAAGDESLAIGSVRVVVGVLVLIAHRLDGRSPAARGHAHGCRRCSAAADS